MQRGLQGETFRKGMQRQYQQQQHLLFAVSEIDCVQTQVVG
jgi:hypothetical protein